MLAYLKDMYAVVILTVLSLAIAGFATYALYHKVGISLLAWALPIVMLALVAYMVQYMIHDITQRRAQSNRTKRW